MKNRIKVLFIDDYDVEDIISSISRTLRKEGKDLEVYILDISDAKYKEEVVKGGDVHIVKKLIIEDMYEQGLMDVDFDIVACDFNFSDEYVNGYDLISKLIAKAKQDRKRIRKARIVFYTGQVQELKNVVIGDVKGFVNLKVEAIVDRLQVIREIVKLSNIIGEELNLEQMLIKHLEPHKDLIFENIYPNFVGKTLAQIIHEIEVESSNGKTYLNSLVELTVAHMIKLQE